MFIHETTYGHKTHVYPDDIRQHIHVYLYPLDDYSNYLGFYKAKTKKINRNNFFFFTFSSKSRPSFSSLLHGAAILLSLIHI